MSKKIYYFDMDGEMKSVDSDDVAVISKLKEFRYITVGKYSGDKSRLIAANFLGELGFISCLNKWNELYANWIYPAPIK